MRPELSSHGPSKPTQSDLREKSSSEARVARRQQYDDQRKPRNNQGHVNQEVECARPTPGLHAAITPIKVPKHTTRVATITAMVSVIAPPAIVRKDTLTLPLVPNQCSSDGGERGCPTNSVGSAENPTSHPTQEPSQGVQSSRATHGVGATRERSRWVSLTLRVLGSRNHRAIDQEI